MYENNVSSTKFFFLSQIRPRSDYMFGVVGSSFMEIDILFSKFFCNTIMKLVRDLLFFVFYYYFFYYCFYY